MVTLEPLALHWIGDDARHDDQCAHGDVLFRVGDVTFADPAADHGEFTLTTAAFNLLWSLEADWRPREHQGQLIPCCGFNPWVIGGELVNMGCGRGIDMTITRHPEGVALEDDRGQSARVGAAEWRQAVLGFVEKVMAFHRASPPRVSPQDDLDREGWARFWSDFDALWKRHGHAH